VNQGSVYINKKESDNYNEVDILEVIFDLWKRRKIIIRFILVFISFGLIIAFTTPKEFTSEVRLLPEMSDQKGGSSLLKQFGSLGNLAGINLGLLGNLDAISPNLYPEIAKSTPILLKLLEEEFYLTREKKTVNLYKYLLEYKPFSLPGFLKKYTFGLPGSILKMFRKKTEWTSSVIQTDNDEIIRLTTEQFEILMEIKDRIKSSVDKRNGIVILSVQMPDPLHAAILTNKIAHYLTEYITSYRTEKALFDLNFIDARHKDAEINFLTSQKKLSAFRDENKNIISAKILSEQEKLQAEYNLAFNLYNSLSLELEQARINVQKETPVFKLLSPVEVAILKSKPKKVVILMLSFILGLLLAFSYLILESIFYKIQSRYRTNI